MPTSQEDIVSRFFSAIEQNDMDTVGALYADDVRIWHSFEDQTIGKAQAIGMVAHMGRLGDRKYHVLERLFAGNRVVQRHQVVLTTSDSEYRVNAAMFLTISDGQIIAIEEYVDSRDVDRVKTAMEAAGLAPPAH